MSRSDFRREEMHIWRLQQPQNIYGMCTDKSNKCRTSINQTSLTSIHEKLDYLVEMRKMSITEEHKLDDWRYFENRLKHISAHIYTTYVEVERDPLTQ
jgi:hypothetical protein